MTCPRCQGLMVHDPDTHCLNCGHRPTVRYTPPTEERMNPEREAKAYDNQHVLARKKTRKAAHV